MAGILSFEELKEKLLIYKKATMDFPFDDITPVFKVMNKMFALISIDSDPLRMNLKCDPDEAQALRSLHKAIIPGYHMNKRHWNSIILDGSIPEPLIDEMIDHSYELVVKGLKKADREQLI